MTAPRYIEHLTLTTGHTRRCWREEVADNVLELLRPLIDHAVESGGHAPLPDVVSPRCTITATTGRGRALLVSIWAPPVEGQAEPTPLLTLGVAPTSLAGAELWRQMVPGGGEEQMPRPDAPPVPWCAVKLHETAALWPEALSWLGDFERCLAWAWVQRQLSHALDWVIWVADIAWPEFACKPNIGDVDGGWQAKWRQETPLVVITATCLRREMGIVTLHAAWEGKPPRAVEAIGDVSRSAIELTETVSVRRDMLAIAQQAVLEFFRRTPLRQREPLWKAGHLLLDAGLRYHAAQLSDDPDGDLVYEGQRGRWRLRVGLWGAAVTDLDSGAVKWFDRVEDAVAHLRSREKP